MLTCVCVHTNWSLGLTYNLSHFFPTNLIFFCHYNVLQTSFNSMKLHDRRTYIHTALYGLPKAECEGSCYRSRNDRLMVYLSVSAVGSATAEGETTYMGFWVFRLEAGSLGTGRLQNRHRDKFSPRTMCKRGLPLISPSGKNHPRDILSMCAKLGWAGANGVAAHRLWTRIHFFSYRCRFTSTIFKEFTVCCFRCIHPSKRRFGATSARSLISSTWFLTAS